MINVEFIFNHLRCQNLSKTLNNILSSGRINTNATPLVSLALEQQDDSYTLAYILIVLTDKNPNEQGETVRINVKVPFFYSNSAADEATNRAKKIYLALIKYPSQLLTIICQTFTSYHIETLRLQSFDAATGKPVIDIIDTGSL